MTLQTAAPSIKRKRGIPVRRNWYLPIMPSNADGKVSPGCDTVEDAFRTLPEACAYASEIVEEHGGEFIVYQAVPVARVTRRGVEEL